MRAHREPRAENHDRVRLSGAKKTLIYTLSFRARDARSANPMVGDPWAEPALDQIDYPRWKLRLIASDRYTVLARARQIDAWTRAGMTANPELTVVHLGCGLDSRAFRLEQSTGTRWYDLDFPDVIELRQRLYPERDDYHLLGYSATDPAWVTEVPTDRPVVVIAEGLLMYLPTPQVWALFDRIVERFPGGELMFDTLAPGVTRLSKLYDWSPRNAHEVLDRIPQLELVDDVPVTSAYPAIPSAGYRWLSRLVNSVAAGRNLMRVQRFRFGSLRAS